MEVEERPKLKLSDLTFDQLASARNKLGDQIKSADLVVETLKAKREKIDKEFLRRFAEQGLTNVKTRSGTPYIITRESYSVADKDAFMGWVKETGAFDFLETRVAKEMAATYKEEHGDIPPGVSYSARLAIGLKKS